MADPGQFDHAPIAGLGNKRLRAHSCSGPQGRPPVPGVLVLVTVLSHQALPMVSAPAVLMLHVCYGVVRVETSTRGARRMSGTQQNRSSILNPRRWEVCLIGRAYGVPKRRTNFD